MYLLDTPVLLALRHARAGTADPQLAAWATAIPREQLFLSALTLAEVETLAATAGRGSESGSALRRWIDDQLVPAFDGQILALTAAIARRRGQLPLAATRDALVAATALDHALTLVTLDPAAYRGARLKLFDPRSYDPATAEEADDWRAARSAPLWLRNLFLRG